MKSDNTNDDDLRYPEIEELVFTEAEQAAMDSGVRDMMAKLDSYPIELVNLLGLDLSTSESCASFVKEAAKAADKASKSMVPMAAPLAERKSVSVTLRIPGTVLAAFRQQAPKHGLGYQSLINRVLKDAATGW